MSPMLCFSNPGLLDPRLITTFGASAKSAAGGSPFGRFGTGLKYAIAGTLRLGGSISIHSGPNAWSFQAAKEVIRDKEFQTVHMLKHGAGPEALPQPCGFTTDLGSHWEPWMLYREFYCNALDERGSVTLTPATSPHGLNPEWTYIYISCPVLLTVHSERHKYFLSPDARPDISSPSLEVFFRPSEFVFFKGVRVHKLPKPGLFTYNLTDPTLELTEDRTLSGTWSYANLLAELLLRGKTSKEFFFKFLLAPEGTFEQTLDLNYYSWHNPSEEFFSLTRELMRNRSVVINPGALRLLHTAFPKEKLAPARKPTPAEAFMLSEGIHIADLAGIPISSPIHIVDSLGPDVLGAAYDQEIWISSQAFLQGQQCLTGTLLEEQIHITHGFRDSSRSMQNFLLELVVRLAQGLTAESAPVAGPLELNDESPF